MRTLKYLILSLLVANVFLKANADPVTSPLPNWMAMGYLGPFQLIDPADSTIAIVQSGGAMSIDFQWSDSDSAQEYFWVADRDSNNLSNPYLLQSVGFTNYITFYSGTLDALAENYGVAQGDTLLLYWTAWAINGEDTLKAEQVFRFYIIRYSEPPEPFDLVSPTDQSNIALNYDSTTFYPFTWTSTERGFFFDWHLESASGNFQNPLWTKPVFGGAMDTSIQISNWELDSFLAALGLPNDESVQLKWSIEAYNLFGSKLANSAHLITIKRPADTTTVNSFTTIGSQGFSVYPNPVRNKFTIEIPQFQEQFTLHIYNSLGKLVISEEVNSKILSIDLSNQQTGVYLLRIESANNVYERKILKH